MHMPEGEPHPSTLPGFRETRDPERAVTHSRSGRRKKRVEFEDVQPQSIPNPTQENFPRRCITKLPDGVSHIYYTGKELTNRDLMRVHGIFTTVFKVWKDIATIIPVRDAVVNIFGQFMDIRLGNSDNRLIEVLTERWWPTTDMFLFPCAEIGVTPLDFTILTSLSIGRYPTQDDITIAHVFILFMMGHLWFQTANNTVPLGYLAAVADLDSAAQYDWGSAILASLYHDLDTVVTAWGAITGFVQLLMYWFYEYCGVGHPIVKEEVKFSAYPRLRARKRWNRRKTNDQATNLFILGRYHIDHHTIEMITWEPWLESEVSEIENVLAAKLLSHKRMPLQVCWRQLEGETRISLDPPLSMSPHISPRALHKMRQAGFLDCEQFVVGEERETYASYWAEKISEVGHMFTDSQRMGNIDLFGPTTLRAGITLVMVYSASQDFSLPGEAEGTDRGWHMMWTGRRKMLPIAHLRDPTPMSSSYGAEELWHLTHGMRRLVLTKSARDA
ncbi:hypothetical protein GIB67_021358 [Kingdonia uniflora]|uniref:Aminotransferase-like plant mobile domain-containing protein n=1 Tax=Kingdonia uniflora TaxID=39325 RepID=A0A7J7MD74_9MAGN|nr:hypothetical protein GIB67_021358 [Kingdonia uniflora]